MKPILRCDIGGCKNEPDCDCQWTTGGLPVQTATFCQEHSAELWRRLSGLVSLGEATYRIDGPGVIVEEMRKAEVVL